MADDATADALDTTAADDTGTTTDAGDSTVDDAPATYTQEQVDAIVKTAKRNSARAATKRARDVPQPPPLDATPPATDDGPTFESQILDRLTALQDRLDDRDATDGFATATAGLQLTDEAQATLRSLWTPDNPEAFRKVAESMATATADPDAPPPGDTFGGGAPTMAAGHVRSNEPREWTADDVARMRSDGTFLAEVRKWKTSLGGGHAPVFGRKKVG